jgi:hypothetical protein
MDLNSESCFLDLIYDKFDLAQFTGSHGEKTLYKAISELSVKENDKSVQYNYSDNFFRSDNFTTTHDGLHILFSGCSESEGVGDNIENAWTNILYKKISSQTQCSGFFNLSRSGWGWSRIVVNALIYFEKYGYPDFYFILLPNHLRMHKFFKDGAKNDKGEVVGNWKYLQYYPEGYYNKDRPMMDVDSGLKDSSEYFADEKEYKENFIQFLTSWKLFNKICKDNKVKLIFSTWDILDHQFIEQTNMFDSFITTSPKSKEFDYFVSNYYENNKKGKNDIHKRDGHQGILFHNFWATQFYNEYKKGK